MQPEPVTLDMDFAAAGRRGRHALRGAAARRDGGPPARFTRQDGVEEQWRIMQPLLDAPPPVHPYAPGSWGPAAADDAGARATAAGADRGSRSDVWSMGPLEVVAIEFPGRQFKNEVMGALAAPVEHGVIRIIDLTFLSKDASGAVTSYELSELDEQDAAHFDLVDRTMGLLSVADLERIGARLATDSSAALIVVEHAWAADFERAVLGAHGRRVVDERIPDEVARAALDHARSEQV